MSSSNEQRYEIVGLTRKEAVACADLLAGGSALWVEGHAYPDSHLVVRPIRQPVEPTTPRAVVITVDAVDGDKAALGTEVTLRLDGATPEFVTLRVGDQVGIPVRTAPPPSEWQPIATAPKDGRRILAVGMGPVFFAHWGDGANVWQDDTGAYREPRYWKHMPEGPCLASVTKASTLEERQRELPSDAKAVLYGRMRELYRRDTPDETSATPFTPMDREALRKKIETDPDPDPEIGAGTAPQPTCAKCGAVVRVLEVEPSGWIKLEPHVCEEGDRNA